MHMRLSLPRSSPAGTVAILAIATLGVACHSASERSAPIQGAAFLVPADSVVRLRVAPGDEWVTQTAILRNISDTPIGLISIRLVGSTEAPSPSPIQIVSTEMAPLARHPDITHDWTPGGVFSTYPPTILLPGSRRCNIQRLRPVAGMIMAPGAESRIAVRMRPFGQGSSPTLATT